MFSELDNPTYVARAVALGAAGYLSKAPRRRRSSTAIQAAAKGEIDLVAGRAAPRDRSAGHAAERGRRWVPFTKRENEVLKQLAFGLSNKEIALALGISYETVKEHVQHILRKIGVSDRTQAAVWAVRKELV